MAVLMQKTRTSGVPTYLNEHLVPHVVVRATRSASLLLLTVPKLITAFSRHSFCYSALITCNSLPSNILLCNSDSVSKKHLKTFLFNTA